MNKTKKNIVLVCIFLVAILTVAYSFRTYYRTKYKNQDIAFVVSKITSTPALRINLYDENGNELDFHNNFTLFQSTGIEIGDSISKHPNSTNLNIYRRTATGKYSIFKSIQQE